MMTVQNYYNFSKVITLILLVALANIECRNRLTRFGLRQNNIRSFIVRRNRLDEIKNM